MPESTETKIRAIDRALSVLDCFDLDHTNMTLSEIAQQVELSPSTTLNILSTLCARGYLIRNERDRSYRLGYRLANLGTVCLNSDDMRSIAHPHMVQLRNQFNESVGLFIATNMNERICIDAVNSTRPLHSTITVGARRLLTRGAAGKILLACLPEDRIREILHQDANISYQDLMDIRAQRYAISDNEYGEGITSVAAPIFDATQKLRASICHSIPVSRSSAELMKRMTEATLAAAEAISKELGY